MDAFAVVTSWCEKGSPHRHDRNAMRGDRERCLEVGMDDYIPKPIQFAALVKRVERGLAPDSPKEDQEWEAWR